MDQLQNWLSDNKIPIGDWIAEFVDAINGNGFFDAVSTGLGALIDGFTNVLESVPPFVLILVIAVGVFVFKRNWKLSVFIALALLFIFNQGYWTETLETLSLIIYATAVCMIIGVPVGIAAAHRPWLFNALRPLLDLMQTLPTFVYLIPTLVLFGLGAVPGLISTIIFALPAPIRLTHLGVSSVPEPLLEAGKAFGASKSQLLWKVELPHALPTIMAGLTQCIMLSLSMVVIAALVGAGGLGVPVVRALNSVRIDMGFEAGLSIVVLAIILDRICRPADADKRKV
ncbi:MAG: choline ABC transporter permease subunit [Parvibaculaceae bacterium]|nr:choline ABC transporter permease subunit [Parvibaculaceae bacterium]